MVGWRLGGWVGGFTVCQLRPGCDRHGDGHGDGYGHHSDRGHGRTYHTYPSYIVAHTPVHRFWCPFSGGALHIPCGFPAHTLGNVQGGCVRGYVRACASPIPGRPLSGSPSGPILEGRPDMVDFAMRSEKPQIPCGVPRRRWLPQEASIIFRKPHELQDSPRRQWDRLAETGIRSPLLDLIDLAMCPGQPQIRGSPISSRIPTDAHGGANFPIVIKRTKLSLARSGRPCHAPAKTSDLFLELPEGTRWPLEF